ncbi:MAG: hypothetical protein E7398_05755 [Ruminococcaceae bacterium]|nr:hypothetical protein [Oscillospiraceae bacterium]
MIIEKLVIENFGKFKNYEIEFKEGINTLCGENETGKSTICAFILAMFYDFTEKGKGIRDDLRTRYLPWSGEPMKGEVHFSHENKKYILKRRMGKTARGAKVTLLDGDTWEEIGDERKESPGEYFFSVPYDSFFKTVYISQLGVSFERGKKDELFEKLSNINQSGDEDISCRKTILGLEKQMTELISVSGTGGKIVRLKAETEELKRKLFKAEETEADYKNAAIYVLEAEKTKEKLLSERERLQGEKLSAQIHEKYLTAKSTLDRFNHLKAEKERREKELSDAYERLKSAGQENDVTSFPSGISYDTAQILESLSTQSDVLEKKLSELSEKREKMENELINIKRAKKVSLNPFMAGLSVILFTLAAILAIYVLPLFGILAVPAAAVLFFAFKPINKKDELDEKYAEIEKLRQELSQENNLLKEKDEIKREIADILAKTQSATVVDLLNKIAEKKALAERVKSAETEYRLIKESLELILPEFYKLSQKVDSGETDIKDNNYKGANTAEIDKELSLLNEKMLICEKNLAEAKTNMRVIEENDALTYSEIATQIAGNEEQTEELLRLYKAIELALSLIKESYEELKSGFAPELVKYVKDAVSFLTDGKYSDVRISDDYKLTVMADGEIVSAEYLSGGTYDVLYLSLRLGLLKVLFDGKVPFLILDDAFLQLDSNRAKKAAMYIKKENTEQVLYFTCRDELKDIFEGEPL